MTQVVSNDVSAIQPELWSEMVQVPLYKSLVSLEVANMKLSDTLRSADTIHVPRFGDLSAQVYTPGTSLSATNQEWDYDTLVVSTYKHCTFYVDNARALTINVDQARELAGEAAYQLKNAIDSHVFANITGADGFQCVDASIAQGGTAAREVSAASGTIINVFSNLRKELRDRNVEETGDWCAVVTPAVAAVIEVKATAVGYNVADATLRNGYVGDFMGFQIYLSNNLPSGACSTIAPPTATWGDSQVDWQGVSATAASATTCRSIYVGRKGTIDVVLMRAPALEIRPKDDMIGSNYITWTVYGSAVFEKNRKRGINVPINVATAG